MAIQHTGISAIQQQNKTPHHRQPDVTKLAI